MTTAIIFIIAITMVLSGIIAILYFNTPSSPKDRMFVVLRNDKEYDQHLINEKARKKAIKFEIDLEFRRREERILKEDSIKQDILNKLEERARGGDLLAFEQWKKMANIQTNKKK